MESLKNNQNSVIARKRKEAMQIIESLESKRTRVDSIIDTRLGNKNDIKITKKELSHLTTEVTQLKEDICKLQVKYEEMTENIKSMEDELLTDVFFLRRIISQCVKDCVSPNDTFIYSHDHIHREFTKNLF